MTEEIVFEPWPKIARLNREIIVTEKLDGTNAAVIVTEDGRVGAQSRNRLITPDDDNYGFAQWVHDNAEDLKLTLGPGRHFGEWWGAGIQRKYGIGRKVFSLFNTSRWSEEDLLGMDQLSVVPVLYRGVFDHSEISNSIEKLRSEGSVAAPGFANPEGVVVFHTAAREFYKVTLQDDEVPKEVARRRNAKGDND